MSLVLYERDERNPRIGYVTLNRPEKLNALSRDLLRALRATWAEVAQDDTTRVIVFRGAGRAFCAGADLGIDRRDSFAGEKSLTADRARVHEMLGAAFDAWELPKPVIAQVHGYLFAGGLLYPLLSDMVVFEESCRIGWPKLPVGGGMIGPAFSWVIGPYRAKEFSFNVGSEFTGKDAVAMGFGNYAVPAAQLQSTVRELAERIARVPGDMLALKKAAVNGQFDARGFKQAVLRGAEFDPLVHTTSAVQVAQHKLHELGMRGAIDWFNREGIA